MSQQGKTGQCLCGAVKYEGVGEPGRVLVCHCPDCLRWIGGPFMAVRFVDGVAVADPAAVNWYTSSDRGLRGSCKNCGAALFWRPRRDPDLIYATVGSLDRVEALEPIEQHVYVEKKPSWYEFADDAPRLTGAEFIARMQER